MTRGLATAALISALVAAADLLVAPAAARAAEVFDGDRARVEVLGDVRLQLGLWDTSRTGLHQLAGRTEPVGPLHGAVLRLGVQVDGGARWRLTVQDRWLLSTTPFDAASASVGVGASVTPPRSLDLSTTLVDAGTTTLSRDVDQAVLRYFGDTWELGLGRQPVTWGNAALFPVLDLWTTFSPFELDTGQKRGVDAARARVSIGLQHELDVLVVDRGSPSDLSAGARWSMYLPRGDLQLVVAKAWTQGVGGLAWTHDLGEVALRLDAAAVLGDRPGDAAEWRARGTAGLDWFREKVQLGFELHHVGDGAAADANLLTANATLPAFARGELYLQRRWYAGVLVGWQARPVLSLSAAALVNLTDGSALLSPTLQYDVAQDVALSAGASVGVGRAPRWSTLTIPSEFGAIGAFGWVAATAWY